MPNWRPATKVEVQRAVEAGREGTEPSYWAKLAPLLVDPYPASVDRFGQLAQAFVVARCAARVVYFEDIEDIFAIATERDGLLTDWAHIGSLPLALNEIAESR